MFERFTDRSRRVLVLAQEEACLLNHGFIGTEHILLGLMDEEDGVAAQALQRHGLSIEALREKVEETVASTLPLPASPPFTPRAKRALELALRESLQLGHNHIGTEHMLLGLLRDQESVAVQVLVSLGTDPALLRRDVLDLLGGRRDPENLPGGVGLAPSRWAQGIHRRSAQLVACSFCGRRPPESGRLVKGQDAFICERCVVEWRERLAASPDDDAPEHPRASLFEPEVGDEED